MRDEIGRRETGQGTIVIIQGEDKWTKKKKTGSCREEGSERKRAIDCEDCRNGSAFWFGWLTGKKSVTANHRKAGLGVFVTQTRGKVGGRGRKTVSSTSIRY